MAQPGDTQLVDPRFITFVARLDQEYSTSLAMRTYGHFFTSPTLATNVLRIIAIAKLTIFTAMAVLSMCSSQFTAQVIEKFLNNETTRKSFRVFLSGLITSLLMIPLNQESSRVLAARIGIFYIIVGFVYFLVFMSHVITHIQASGLILRLQKKAEARILAFHEEMKGLEMMTDLHLKGLLHVKKRELYFHQCLAIIRK